MHLRDAEIREQYRDVVRLHGRASVGMNGELAWHDAVALVRIADQPVGQRSRLTVSDQPEPTT